MATNTSAIAGNTTALFFPIYNHTGQVDLWFTVTTTITSFGSLCYLLFLPVVVFQLKKGNRVDWLILHQVVLEGLVTVVLFPLLNLTTYRAANRMPVMLSCEQIHPWFFWMVNAGDWNSLFLACNRYVALFMPHAYKRLSSRRVLIATILGVHVAMCALNAPMFFGKIDHFMTAPNGECVTKFVLRSFPVIMFYIVFGYWAPLIAAALVYLVIVFKFWRVRRVKGDVQLGISAVAKNLMRRYALSKMLLVCHMWLCACYFISPIAPAFRRLQGNPSYDMIPKWSATVWLTGLATTPLVFFAMNGNYRQILAMRFKRMAGCPAVAQKTSAVHPSLPLQGRY